MPRGEPTVVFKVRLRPTLLKELEEIARADGRSVANLMRHLAEQHVRSVRLEKLIADREDLHEIVKITDEHDKRAAVDKALAETEAMLVGLLPAQRKKVIDAVRERFVDEPASSAEVKEQKS